MNMKVLVVDDSLMIRQQVKRALSGGDLEFVEAKDGVDALEKAEAGSAIDLVICDVSMPRMGGLDFLEAFRRVDRFRAVPVVMLTAEAQPDQIARSRSLGAQGWILKPFKPDLLAATARRLVPEAFAH